MACVAGFDGKKFFFQGDGEGEDKRKTLLALSGKCGNMEAENFKNILVNNLRTRGTGDRAMSFALILMQVLHAQWKANRPFLALKLGGNILDDLIADLAELMKLLHGESQMEAIQVWDPLKILIKPYDVIILDDVTAGNALHPHHFEVVPKLLRPGGMLFLLTARQEMKDRMAKDLPGYRELKINGPLVLLVNEYMPEDKKETSAKKEK